MVRVTEKLNFKVCNFNKFKFAQLGVAIGHHIEQCRSDPESQSDFLRGH